MKFKLNRYTVDLQDKVELWIASKAESEQESLRGQTVSQSLLDMLKEEIKVANQRITEEDPTADELNRIMAPVNAAAKAYNMSRQMDRLEELSALSYDDAVAAYLADQTVGGYAPSAGKESKEIENKSCRTYLKPYDFFANMNPIGFPGIKDLAWLYLDNTLRYWVGESADKSVDKEKVAPCVDKPHLEQAWIDLRKRFGWNEKPSKSAMKRQIATVWKWMLGENVAPTDKDIRNCDIAYLVNSAAVSVDKANSHGTYKVCSDVDFINYIFRAAVTCRAHGVYKMVHGGRDTEKRLPESTSINKDMAEPPVKPSSRPVVSESTAEHIKPETKKSTKKPRTKKAEEKPAEESAAAAVAAEPSAEEKPATTEESK